MSLAPCRSCSRHLRVSETVCPFCGDATRAATSEASRPGRLSRVAAAVSVALTVGACQRETGPAPAYGGPPMNDSMRQVTPPTTPNAAPDAAAAPPAPKP